MDAAEWERMVTSERNELAHAKNLIDTLEEILRTNRNLDGKTLTVSETKRIAATLAQAKENLKNRGKR